MHSNKHKKSTLGDDIYHVFTVGDQLLWGASEPLRQVLLSIINTFLIKKADVIFKSAFLFYNALI